MRISRIFLPLILLFGSLATVAAASQTGQIIAAKVEGKVTQTLPDQSIAVLHNGDTVSTGGIVITAADASVVLVFSNGATVELGGDSQLSVDQFLQDPFDMSPTKVSQLTKEPSVSHMKLNLTKGELVAHVAHLRIDEGSECIVQTPVGAAGIRGTTFQEQYHVMPDGTVQFALTVTEGAVNFTLSDGRVVSVTAGNVLALSVGPDGKITFNVEPSGPVDFTAPVSDLLLNGSIDGGVIHLYYQDELDKFLPPPPVPAPSRTTPGDGNSSGGTSGGSSNGGGSTT